MISTNLINLPSFDSKTGKLNVIVETPKGSRNKYNYDGQRGIFKLKKILPVGASFPFDFGFVPSTRGADCDPLDVLLLMEQPTFPGCLVVSRLIGVIEATQKKRQRAIRNDRIIAVADEAEIYCRVKSLTHLNATFLEQIEHFFISYNAFEGKQFKPLRRVGPPSGMQIVKSGQQAFAGAHQNHER